MNIILAIVWLLLGIGLLVFETLTESTRFRILGSQLSMAWFCFVLAIYNCVRWYSQRAWKKDQESIKIVEAARRRQSRDRAREDHNPAFDFTDKPPEKPFPPDVPPSNN